MPHIADRRFTDHSVYDELRDHHEVLYERRGGRLVLGRDGVHVQHQAPPLLKQLRAGHPVELPDWMVPRHARPGGGGPVRNVRLRVHPSGLVEEV